MATILQFKDHENDINVDARHIVAISRFGETKSINVTFPPRTKVEFYIEPNRNWKHPQVETHSLIVYDSEDDFQKNLKLWKEVMENL